ncbi:type IV fimbrial biogenesis protein FimT [Desulfonatronum thiosulfatophilum]|uniref:Type II secretion system protein H n=1 Tax=Desulfonatronum thiosulfatophilum TaxID=617002 RepID=A0A1G6A3G8_9BACT|nr:GspH/FimT family pseudopilin [Desulfonatronum thiosulfatophilum]SDB02756.1 type IV fimbrial biogenesis protein FimT [Desulfonatronum thiosulfatophilum]
MKEQSFNNQPSGLTFIEVLVAIAIALILMAVATPYVMGMLRNAGVSTVAHEFLTALNYARSEAIKRNHRITICKSSNGTECTVNGGWEQGWIIFTDATNTGTVEDPSQILKIRRPLGSGFTLSGNMPVRNYISYVSNGSTQYLSGAFQAGTLTLCRQSRGVKFVLARAGRVRTESHECGSL